MKPPKLAKHKARGVYFIKYGGRFIYFSRDPDEARRLYLAHLDEHWLPYARAKSRQRGPAKDSLRVVELAEHYLAHVLTDRSRKLMVDYRGYLSEFIRAWGALPVEKMEAQLLQDMKTDMAAAGVLEPRGLQHRQRGEDQPLARRPIGGYNSTLEAVDHLQHHDGLAQAGLEPEAPPLIRKRSGDPRLLMGVQAHGHEIHS